MEKNINGYSVSNQSRMTDDVPLSMVYSPYQQFRRLYTPEDALEHGTLFEELFKPLVEDCADE